MKFQNFQLYAEACCDWDRWLSKTREPEEVAFRSEWNRCEEERRTLIRNILEHWAKDVSSETDSIPRLHAKTIKKEELLKLME